MKISAFAIKELIPYIIDTRKGSELVTLFNGFGVRDVYDELGLPDIKKLNGQRPSKKEYVNARVTQLNNKNELRELLSYVMNNIENGENLVDKFNEILNPESYNVIVLNGQLILEGGVVDKRKPVVNEAHFQDIQNQILIALDNARVSIRVVMAWFTNELLLNKLVEKQKQGIDIKVALYDDGVNKKHGVDLSQLPHTLIKRGTGGGLMHDKFCIIDNQIVITGSYNWTNNAEFRNDENIIVANDPEQATNYSEEFRRLTIK